MERIQTNFLRRNPLVVAQALLGKIIVHETERGEISGRITETEAYQADIDKSAHSYKGKSERNRSLYLGAGHLYLFKIHKYICLDIVTGKEGVPNSVLLRSLEPIKGIELMKENRKKEEITELTTGPGKLVQALDIPFLYDGYDICKPDSKIYILDDGYDVGQIVQTTRIGISTSTELQNRFYIASNEFISRK